MSAESLIEYYPRDYELFDKPRPIYELTKGEVASVIGVIERTPTIARYNGLTVVNAYLGDMTGHLQLSWFNAPYIKNSIIVGKPYVFRGRVTMRDGRVILNQPRIYPAEAYERNYLGRMMPIYHLTRGMTNKTVVNAVAEALKALPEPTDYLPDKIRNGYSLCTLGEARLRIHFPRSMDELKRARRRLIFDEFFIDIVAGRIYSGHIRSTPSRHKTRPDIRIMQFMAALPFELTAAQTGAYRDITRDMNSGSVMNRLIEGDVGSGKTIVALLAAIYAALNGFQAVFMAPTAVLAAQHYETLGRLIADYVRINDADPESAPRAVLLTGAHTRAQKNDIWKAICDHEADIVIGTHAVFQDKVEYADLGLVITDEQHRFGVGQREAIKAKGDLPHMLVMSATPIPRTLSLILYNGMDQSIIDTLPSGRLPIQNAVVGPKSRNASYKFIYEEIKKGAQAYVICPAIEAEAAEEGSAGGLMASGTPLENVTDYAGKLRDIFPAEVRIGLLHGRMKDLDKQAVMEAFKAHETDILVSTTVVEVGVDVPDATVMMIENAERYGLAELHQLRGRVGRGIRQSYCIFINTSDSEKAGERLGILAASNDGFAIAEKDLALRGPGDIFGVRQSGEAGYILGDIYRDHDVLMMAGEAADELLSEDPDLGNESLKALKSMVNIKLSAGTVL